MAPAWRLGLLLACLSGCVTTSTVGLTAVSLSQVAGLPPEASAETETFEGTRVVTGGTEVTFRDAQRGLTWQLRLSDLGPSRSGLISVPPHDSESLVDVGNEATVRVSSISTWRTLALAGGVTAAVVVLGVFLFARLDQPCGVIQGACP